MVEEHRLERYNSCEGAVSYRSKFKRHWTERVNNYHEQALVRRLLRDIPKDDLTGYSLDMPCGYGRLYPLVQERAAKVVESDWSFFLLQESRRYLAQLPGLNPAQGHIRANALAVPYKDRAFDLVVSVRLCHHIPEYADRLRYLGELLRISDKWVVFTYFDTDSIKNMLHERARRANSGKRQKWTLSRQEVAATAEAVGFDVVKTVPLARLFSGHCYTVLRRKSEKTGH